MKWRVILFILALVLLVLANSACKKDDSLTKSPECIQTKLKEKLANGCSAVTLTRYRFQKKTVYSFEEAGSCADFFQEVYDENCSLICNLGGIAGIKECNGENFSNATQKEILFEK